LNLWQVDINKRIPYSPNPSGYYYWCSLYYVDRDEFTSDSDCIFWVLAKDRLLCTEDVGRIGWRVHDPPGRGNVIINEVFTTGSPGLIDSEGSYSLINIARWWLYSSTGRRTYRLNRMPLRPSDMDGMNLSDSGYATQVAALTNFLFPTRLRNSYGEYLTSGEVVRPLVMWQLRHGTKRRRRNPLA
jgi:hypothetical protein